MGVVSSLVSATPQPTPPTVPTSPTPPPLSMVCTPEPAGTWQTLPESSTSPRGPLMLMLSQRLTTDMDMDIPTTDWDILATGTDTPPAPTTMARGPLMLSLSLTMDI